MLDAVIYLKNGTRIEVTKQTLKYILIGFGFEASFSSLSLEDSFQPDPPTDCQSLLDAVEPAKPAKSRGKSQKTV